MDQPKDLPVSRLAPVDTVGSNNVEKVDDSVNRSLRTAQNLAVIGLALGVLNRATGLSVTVDQAIGVLVVVVPILAYVRNVAEYRGWIPSTKTKAAEIAAPVNADGQVLGQVKV